MSNVPVESVRRYDKIRNQWCTSGQDKIECKAQPTTEPKHRIVILVTDFLLLTNAAVKPLSCKEAAISEKMLSIPTIP